MNIVANNFEAPLLVIVNQHTTHQPITPLDKQWLQTNVLSQFTRAKTNCDVKHIDLFVLQQRLEVKKNSKSDPNWHRTRTA